MIKTIAESISGVDILLAKREKDAVCISIIVPLHKPSPGKKENKLILRKAITAASQYLSEKYNGQISAPLLSSLDELAEIADTGIHAEGLGLFVSNEVKLVIPFFQPVREKIIVSDSFEVRDVLYQNYYSAPYFVLHLTEKEVRLFEGKFETLIELKEKFPIKYTDDYEYSRPSRGSSYVGSAFIKDFEQDKSRLVKLRYESFLREADKALSPYLGSKKQLVICGVESDMISFKKHTNHGENIIGQLVGNYTYETIHKLAASAWKVVQRFYDEQKDKLIAEFKDLFGTERAITGLVEIWRAASEGRAYQLIVEKDYCQSGFIVAGESQELHLKPPVSLHYTRPDVVNDLMQLVISKGGEVIIVENGLLEDYQHIVLLARY